MDKIRVGIIGCGSISRCHLSAYKQLDNVELVACADMNFERAQAYARENGFQRAYPSAEAMMAQEKLDAVSVCTWNNGHAPCSIAALKAGANVLCEKPLAMNTEEAREMAETARKTGKLLMVGFVRRFGENTQMLKSRIDSGDFGEIYYAKTGCIRRVGNPGGWFSNKQLSGGGPLIDLGVHMIDLTRYLMGKPKPVSVYGSTFDKLGPRANIKGIQRWTSADWSDFNDVEDMAVGMIHYDNGATVFVENSWTQHIDTPEHLYLELYGSKCGAIMEPELKLMSEKNDYLIEEHPVVGQDQSSFDNNFAREIRHFVDCVANGTPCLNPAEDGVELMRILDALYESARLGHEVRLQ